MAETIMTVCGVILTIAITIVLISIFVYITVRLIQELFKGD
jgi:hypothetical protein